MDILETIISTIKTKYQDQWRGFDQEASLKEARSKKDARIPLRLKNHQDLANAQRPEISQGSKGSQNLEVYQIAATANTLLIIAEIKQASPSQGLIVKNFQPLKIAQLYAESGVDAISVLTEEDYFKGSINYLTEIKKALPTIPLLRKDFIVHPYQVHEAYKYGADLVLLIVAALQDKDLVFLFDYIEAYGMTALVEVHNQTELERALKLKPKLLGINNRNLKNFKVDLEITKSLIEFVNQKHVLANLGLDRTDLKIFTESGIKNPDDLKELKRYGIDGALIGQSILEHADPRALLKELQLI